MRILARIVVSVAAAIAYTFAFSAVTLVVFALTHDTTPSKLATSTLEMDTLPTWVRSLYVAGLAGVVFLVGFRLWRRTR